jgi:glycosyltransferase involved in cell wall biosynthesis
MLSIASSMSGTTSAKGMEGMTLSMITGDDATFRSQADRLTDWIKTGDTPDVVHLSSTLLLGIAGAIKSSFHIPVLCSVQDEEVWIDSLDHHHASAAWHGIRDGLKYIDGLITTSNFYRTILQKRMSEVGEISVAYPGIDAAKYPLAPPPQHPTIGFFYRIKRENGLDILAEAFVELKKRNTIKHLKLKIGGGYSGASDRQFLKGIGKMLAPYGHDVAISDTYSLEDHAAFYASISLISVPIRYEESVGLYLCEAFAAGRPAVEPSTGSFPEIVGNAGIIYEPNDSHSLANALEDALSDANKYRQLAENAKLLASTRYSSRALSESLCRIYRQHSSAQQRDNE